MRTDSTISASFCGIGSTHQGSILFFKKKFCFMFQDDFLVFYDYIFTKLLREIDF